MDFIEISIFLLFLATISVPLAARTHLPFEIFLVAASAIISLMPGLPQLQINPSIVFNLFLPPILFSAAYFISWQDFKFNFRPISLLAFGLTMTTAFAVAFISSALIPGFTWQEGFLLGAIISPTDATSAVAVIKKLGAQRRLISVLEGESMINDATALVLFRFSIAAVTLHAFSIPKIASQFVIITIGGILVGLFIGVISIYLLQKLRDVLAETTFTFITAFSSYLIAEHLGFSGVISTVVCGIYCGIRFHEFTSFSTRINTKANWQTLIFIINCFVFTIIGIELPSILRNLGTYHISSLILYSLVVILTLFLTRFIWIYAVAYLSRKLVPAIARKDPMPSWQMLFVLSWTNMRGIVSLAAVLAIPIQTVVGTPFPHRNEFIFITYCVIVVTLLIPTITLPILINIFKLTEDSNEKLKEEALARISSLEGVIEKLTDFAIKEKIPKTVFNEFREQFHQRLNIVQTQLDEFPYSTLNDEYSALRKLTLAAIANERETLLKLRKSGEIHNEVFHRLSDELDLEELRAKSLRL
jgi:monovalent cation/hydrogen antiporter